MPSVVGFGAEPGVLFVATTAGSFYRAAFDTRKGGQATQESFYKFASSGGGGGPGAAGGGGGQQQGGGGAV